MEKNGKIIGQNVFIKTHIDLDDGTKLPIMTMGSICIANEYKRLGYDKMLLDYSIEKAKDYGCKALFFEGNIDFYGKSGFIYAYLKKLDITDYQKAQRQISFCAKNLKKII